VSAIDLKGLLAGAGDEHERWARTINPQFVRVLRTIGFDRTWAGADGAYLYDSHQAAEAAGAPASAISKAVSAGARGPRAPVPLASFRYDPVTEQDAISRGVG